MMQTVMSAALQQQESVARRNVETWELADSSKAAFTDQNDPVNPFTLFGTTRYNHSGHFALQHAESLRVVMKSHTSKRLQVLLALAG